MGRWLLSCKVHNISIRDRSGRQRESDSVTLELEHALPVTVFLFFRPGVIMTPRQCHYIRSYFGLKTWVDLNAMHIQYTRQMSQKDP